MSMHSGHGEAPNQPVRGLSREVLRWLQSLDLAYSVRNVSRDFATGFLIAEILSRYDSSIHMHSYDNGVNIVKRKDNWRQLCKFFQRADIPYTDDEVGRIIHYEKSATVDFVNRLYTLLTQRRVKAPPVRQRYVDAPPFAKDTASLALKQRLKDPEMSEVYDLQTQEAALRKRLREHEQSLREEKEQNPSRFQPSKSNLDGRGSNDPSSPSRQQSKILRGPTRRLGMEQKTESIQVKQVQVKHIERNVANIRASKEMHARDVTGAVGSYMDGSIGGVEGSIDEGSAVGGENLPGVAARTILNQIVQDTVEGTKFQPTIGNGEDSADNYSNMLPELSDEIHLRILSEIRRRRKELAPRCLANPRDFWRVCQLFCNCMDHFQVGTETYSSSSDCFRGWAMALQMRAKALDGHGSLANQEDLQRYFSDFALPTILDLVRTAPNKRQDLLKIAYSFTVNDVSHHKTLIRLVQQRLNHLRTFLHCLVGFATLEEDLLLDSELMDLYVYYTTIALGMSSPSLRAAAISVLVLLVPQNPVQGAGLLKDIGHLASDTWWEVRVQMVVLACTLLTCLPADDENYVQIPLNILNEHFHVDAPLAVKKASLSYLASALRLHPQLTRTYLDVLMSLPSHELASLLKMDTSNGVVGNIRLQSSRSNGGGGVILHSLPLSWDNVGVASQVAQRMLEHDQPRVERDDALILLTCLDSAGRSDEIDENGQAVMSRVELNPDGPDADQWREVFRKMCDYLLVALADPYINEYAVPIVRIFITELQLGSDLFQDGGLAFTGMLDLLFPMDESNSDIGCQERLCEMLNDAVGLGPNLGAAIVGTLNDFKATRPALFETDSPIALLLRNLA